MPLNPDWVLSGLGYEQSADQVGVLMNFLKQPELPTAIFTVRDYRAGWLFEARPEGSESGFPGSFRCFLSTIIHGAVRKFPA